MRVRIIAGVISLSYYLRFDHQFAENVVEDVRIHTLVSNFIIKAEVFLGMCEELSHKHHNSPSRHTVLHNYR